MAKERILVVDDEVDLLKLVSYNLENYGYNVDTVTTGVEALEKVRKEPPDIIILDLMLPGIDGLEVCRIIILTAKGEEADIVTGLELGADDYVTKPFSPRVLLARIKAFLRRGKDQDNMGVFSKHGITLNTTTHEVSVDGNLSDLTATEFAIL